MKDEAHAVEEVTAAATATATPAPVGLGAAVALLGRQGDAGALARSALELQRAAGNRSLARRVLARKKKAKLPSYVVSPKFCGTTAVNVNPEMAKRLAAAEKSLKATFDALPAEERYDHVTGKLTTDFGKWVGCKSIGGYKPGSFHASGSAIDVDVNYGPYIATRTPDGKGGYTYGGEAAGAGLQAERKRALEVNDRAAMWIGVNSSVDLSARKKGESIADVYDRFMAASSALQAYMFTAIRYFQKDDPTKRVDPFVRRRPIKDAWDPAKVSDDDLLAKIPETERLPKDEAVKAIQAFLDNEGFKQLHATNQWTLTAEQTYFQALRDYETVRIPWVSGKPEALPPVTRNPIHGFLYHQRDLVIALVEVGKLHWGACDLGAGSSGDMHHFDLRMHPPEYQPEFDEVPD